MAYDRGRGELAEPRGLASPQMQEDRGNLEAIEAVLQQPPKVREATVVVQKQHAQDSRLVASQVISEHGVFEELDFRRKIEREGVQTMLSPSNTLLPIMAEAIGKEPFIETSFSRMDSRVSGKAKADWGSSYAPLSAVNIHRR